MLSPFLPIALARLCWIAGGRQVRTVHMCKSLWNRRGCGQCQECREDPSVENQQSFICALAAEGAKRQRQ